MNKRLFGLLLAFVLLMHLSIPVSAAVKEEKETISIENAAQLLAFAESCRLDTYSRGLTVSLEADIDLSQEAFFPIPIFSGIFDGNGHMISGLHLTADGSEQGLFRYLTSDAVVKNLIVKGKFEPDGSRSNVGAIAGHNFGIIQDCSVDATVCGSDSVGGLVGVNAVTGIIEKCSMNGSVTGNHFVGGIAGENTGVIRNCVNEARINTTAQENRVELSDVTVESLTNTESSGTVTDIGGVAGTSSGVIRDSRNTAGVGYRHMGYNIGGIAGTQSGYIFGCENTGSVYGRKEVGGIVGHMEPFSELEFSADALQILKGQLNTLSSLTSQASSNAQTNASSITGQIGELQEHTNTAMAAIDVLRPGSGADADSITAAQNALSSSVSGITGSVGEIGSAASGTATDLSRDLNAISNQISVMSRTLDRTASAVGGSFEDISDADTAKQTGGEVEACVNQGSVFGDLNIGGIAGAMAMQNDLDAEDDWYVSGEASMNLSGEIRAVITDCENNGTVTGNKRNIGGIVGWQYIGLVKDAVNLGAVVADSADYVGGISGNSSGYIRGCGAKCTLSGSTYVGGVAGIAGIATDCHSMVEISGGKERIGAVLGFAQTVESEEKQPISGNYYLVIAKDIGGIDGISYAGQAEAKDIDAFVALDEIEEPFRTVTLRFVFEKGEPMEIIVPLGGSVSKEQIPDIPEKIGYVSEWEGLSDADLNNVLFDMKFKPLYISRNSVIASQQCENGKPIVLVQGVFTSEAAVDVKEAEDGPSVGFGTVVQEIWRIEPTERENVEAVRFQLPQGTDPDHIRMYVCDNDNVWRSTEFTVDGSYAVVPYTADDVAVAYAQTPVLTYMLAVMLIGAMLVGWQYKDTIRRKK